MQLVTILTMIKFNIEGVITSKNLPFTIEAVHSDDLRNRNGYNTKFLGIDVPLPTVAPSLQKDIASLQKDIGRNGNQVLDYTHFSVVFNKRKKLPFYTVVNIEGLTNLMNMVHEARGSDSWLADDRIFLGDNKFQYGNKDYQGSGLQKGHLVRYFDPAWGSTDTVKMQAVGDTFHYSNCCPQIPYYNSVVWNYLEDYYLARAIFQDKKITVFSGPIFNKARSINGLLVPVNFWKVIVYKTPTGLAAMGLIMSQEKYFDRLKLQTMRSAEMPLRALTKDSIAQLYNRKELIDAKVKISLIEEKIKISFGLNDIDEKKDDDRLDIEIISPPSAAAPQAATAIRKLPPGKPQKAMQDFFDAM